MQMKRREPKDCTIIILTVDELQNELGSLEWDLLTSAFSSKSEGETHEAGDLLSSTLGTLEFDVSIMA